MQKEISFIIVTYNRPNDLIELLKNILSLDNSKNLIKDIIVLNNCSTVSYSEVESFINSENRLVIKYIVAPENFGVTKGRNYAISQCLGRYIVMIDDDAILQNSDCLIAIITEFTSQKTKRPVAIVSFKVLYYSNLEMQRNALPHKNFNKYKSKEFFETYYYAGGAHVITREAVEKFGLYPENFFYGMEEYDLSFRVLEGGYSIVYTNKVIMLHKESPQGRQSTPKKIQMMWVNKSKVAWKYLPKSYFYSTAFMWSLQYLRLTNLDIKGFFQGFKFVSQIPKSELRTPIKKETFKYIKSIGGRLWY